MGLILDYMASTSDGKVKTYDSQKRFIDEPELDTFGEFDDHKYGEQPKDKSLLYAEDKYSKEPHVEIKSKDILSRKGKSRFKYFLDGTRHVYKVGDIAIDGTVYPLAVGQIIVGYCGREGRDIKNGYFKRSIVLAVPRQWDLNNQGKNFFVDNAKKSISVSLKLLFSVSSDYILTMSFHTVLNHLLCRS